jgi:hypothetical protein
LNSRYQSIAHTQKGNYKCFSGTNFGREKPRLGTSVCRQPFSSDRKQSTVCFSLHFPTCENHQKMMQASKSQTRAHEPSDEQKNVFVKNTNDHQTTRIAYAISSHSHSNAVQVDNRVRPFAMINFHVLAGCCVELNVYWKLNMRQRRVTDAYVCAWPLRMWRRHKLVRRKNTHPGVFRASTGDYSSRRVNCLSGTNAELIGVKMIVTTDSATPYVDR